MQGVRADVKGKAMQMSPSISAQIGTLILPVAALFGGLMSTLYPVCVAHAHDRMPADRMIAVSSQLILLSGFGSVLGPLIGANLMGRFGINGVLHLMAAAASLLALLAVGRSLVAESSPHLERPFAILAPQAAAIGHDPLRPSQRSGWRFESFRAHQYFQGLLPSANALP